LNEVTLKENQRHEIDQFIERISNEMKSIPQGKIRDVWNHSFPFLFPLISRLAIKNVRMAWKIRH
jgi:hypothetical protein